MSIVDRQIGVADDSAPSSPPDPREPIHTLNGRLLLALKDLLEDAGMNWPEWIINVIMLHRDVAGVETVTLKTSATLWCNEPFFSREQCRRNGRGKVEWLDGDVPMNRSFAGYCIREASIVWEDDMSSAGVPSSPDPDIRQIAPMRHPTEDKYPHPLEDKYRDFKHVGVTTPGPVRSEYVFPIRLRVGLSAAMLGVLNCEWYGPSDQNAFQKIRRSRIAHLITHLLDVHARFVPLAFDRVRAPGGSWFRFLKTYYDPCMALHIERIRKGAPE